MSLVRRLGLAVMLTGAAVAQSGAPANAQGEPPAHFLRDLEVHESAGAATVEVERITSQAFTVAYSTDPLDAEPGLDYTHTEGQLHFAAGGPALLTFQVPIVNDSLDEDEESLSLLLRDSSGKTIDFSELIIISAESPADVEAAGRQGPSDSGAKNPAGPGSKALPPGAPTGSPATGAPPPPAIAGDPTPVITLGPGGPSEPAHPDRGAPDFNSAFPQPPRPADGPGLAAPAAGLFGLVAALGVVRVIARMRRNF